MDIRSPSGRRKGIPEFRTERWRRIYWKGRENGEWNREIDRKICPRSEGRGTIRGGEAQLAARDRLELQGKSR